MMLWIASGIAGYVALMATALGLCRAADADPAEFHLADGAPSRPHRAA
jgi:hypothetical protein